jgi:hypothetical protein
MTVVATECRWIASAKTLTIPADASMPFRKSA